MNPGGLAVIILGVWVGCQVFGGSAFERLGIVNAPASSSSPGAVYTPPAAAGPTVTNVWT